MRASVVVATYNRAASLRVTLDGLRRQTAADFEVVVVAGPCTDETPALLAGLAGELKVVTTEQRNLCVSRNLGIDAAAGDVVAFIDDDAIPEPGWLDSLLSAYTEPDVGGVGGVVYDQTGVRLQYRYSLCDRVGRGIYDRVPQEADNRPGADPFVYLQGTNMSFRRDALAQVGGFDEHIEYVWDEADLAVRLLDAGWRLRPVDGARVHHKLLASSVRRTANLVTDPYALVKNRVYFALRNGLPAHPAEPVLGSVIDFTRELSAVADESERRGELAPGERARFGERLDAGFQAGLELGLQAERAVRPLATADPETFVPFPVRPPVKSVCVLAPDDPVAPFEGGADVHVLAPTDGPYRIDFEHGIWLHRVPRGPRRLPALDVHPLRQTLARAAAFWWAAHEAAAHSAVHIVVGSADDTRVCALDQRWTTVVAAEPTIERGLSEPAGEPSIGAEEAAQAVRRGLQRLLEDLGDVEDPGAAAAELLEPSAFPFDYLAALAPLDGVSHHDFVVGAYRLLLRRDPEPRWLEAALDPLRDGLKTRADVIHEIAHSEEASLLGVDASFTERLPRELAPALERRIRDAFWRDDRKFARLLTTALVGPDAHAEVDAATERLAAGESRHDLLRSLVERADVRRYVPAAPALLSKTFLTPAELRKRLEALSQADDAAFVDAAYRLFLDREPDPEAEGWRRELTRASRRWVLVGIAFSGEAQERGIDPSVVNVTAEAIPALNEAPLPPGAEGKVLRTVRAVQDLGRRRSPSGAPR